MRKVALWAGTFIVITILGTIGWLAATPALLGAG
jgi:hypothetical protein